LTDVELAERIAAGDSDAGKQLVRQYYPGLYRFLRQLTGRFDDAEDLAQLTLIRAHAACRRFDGRASFRTWLHRIAFHEFTRWRRRRRWNLSLSSAPPQDEKQYAKLVEADWLEKGLAKLPDGLRAAFLLHHVEELSIPEVALILGVPEGTVKSRLFHARKRLQVLLGEEANEVKNGKEAYEF